MQRNNKVAHAQGYEIFLFIYFAAPRLCAYKLVSLNRDDDSVFSVKWIGLPVVQLQMRQLALAPLLKGLAEAYTI